MKVPQSVLASLASAALLTTSACMGPPKENTPSSVKSAASDSPRAPAYASAEAPNPARSAMVLGLRMPADGGACQPYLTKQRVETSEDRADAASGEPAPTSSAYGGCGHAIAPNKLWDETSEGEVLDAIAEAKACAAAHDRQLLLEFVAPWCQDCQAMTKLEQTSLVAAMMQLHYERVRVNIGKW
ncbi:MAG TPA: thioredoxin family protein, partial [Polyangiaceae bacterium]|nr:thioredoxin family protein [Polyangiaceae bacterium]